MSSGAQQYNVSAIRELLRAAFTAEELNHLFLYTSNPELRPLSDELSPRTGLEEMVARTITYCEKRDLLSDLLAEVARENPRKYARHYPGLGTLAPTPTPKPPREKDGPDPPAPRRWWYWIVGALLVVFIVILVVKLLPSPPTPPTEPITPSPGFTSHRPPESTTPTWTPSLAVTYTLTPTNAPTPTDMVTWMRPSDGAVMVHVPAGKFLMGSTDYDLNASDNEKPPHTVYLDAFWIDKYEVTNAQYRKCVEARECREPRCWDESNYNAPNQPVVCVDWFDAHDYADWARGRLPTEAEWEKAARGTEGWIFPWGDIPPDCKKANYSRCQEKPLPVGSHLDGASPYGALDMAGNVMEWVADWDDGLTGNYYSQSPYRNPTGPERGLVRVARGGSYHNSLKGIRCAYRYGLRPDDFNRAYGFRVVVAPGPSLP